MERPLTRYAKTKDGVHLAYQVLGDGPVDQLFLPHRPVAIDALWEHPGHLRWTRHASTYSRLIMFDPRGGGASDPASVSCFSDRDSWLEDAEAVMDAVGAEEAVVVGEGFGGLAAINLAVCRPQRTVGLVLVNSYAYLARSD